MINIDSIIEYIAAESAAQCEQIIAEAALECERLRAEYAQTEQDEYWKFVGAGAKETEHHLEQLNDLAAQEAKKQLTTTQQEMVDAAFDLAATRLNELPRSVYNRLLIRLGAESGSSADSIAAMYKQELSGKIAAALFD